MWFTEQNEKHRGLDYEISWEKKEKKSNAGSTIYYDK